MGISKTISFKRISLQLLLLIITFLIGSFMVSSFAQIAPVNPPEGGFNINGLLRAALERGDWLAANNAPATGVLNVDGTPKNPATTGRKTDRFTSNDSIFTNGSKFQDYVGDLRWFVNSAPDKNDINNGLYHVSTDNASHQWLFIAGDRLSTNGTSYIDFELLQGTITPGVNNKGEGIFTGSGPHGGRTVGDYNISMEYTNGGSKPKVVIYEWVAKTAANNSWHWDSTGSHQYTLDLEAYAETNRTSIVPVPFGAFGNFEYPMFAFVEGAIDVSALLESGENCQGLTVKTIWIKTKASASSTAALKDFMDPISVDLNFGNASITPVSPLCLNAGTVTLTADPPGGVFTSSGNGVSQVGSDYVFDPAIAGAGTYTITYTVNLGVGCNRVVTTNITVRPLPGANISGTTSVCRGAIGPNVTFTGSSGTRPYVFSYNINGGGTLTVTTTGTNDAVTVPVSTTNAGTYTYTLTGVTDAYCSGTASGTAVVTVNPLPTASAGSPPTAQCYIASGNSFALSGSATNGTPAWTVQSKSPNDLTVNIVNPGTLTPTVQVSGSSTGGSATLLLTVTSPLCGTATSTVTVTVNGQANGPSFTVVQPSLCGPSTASINICNPVSGYTYYIVGGNYTITANGGTVSFTGLAPGSNPSVGLTTSDGCVSAPTPCGSAVGSCPPPVGSQNRGTDVQENNVTTQEIFIPADRKLGIKAFPNPYNDVIRFVINSEESGQGRLELFNMLGQKVKTVYQGRIAEGVQNFEISVPAQHRSTLIYVMTLNGKQFTGKLLNSSK